MQIHRNTLIALIALLIPGCVHLGLADEHLVFDPTGWELGYQAGDPVQRIVEFVPPGETVEDWTELFTIQTFNKRARLPSVEAMLESQRETLAAKCPGFQSTVTRQEGGSVLYQWSMTQCPDHPAESAVGRILDGVWSRFWVFYSSRTPDLSVEQRAEWLAQLETMEIITT